MILPFSFAANALSATTAEIIHGTAPYLTFNGGITKATNTDELLGIRLSTGTEYKKVNSSTASNPIELPVEGQSMADVGMLVPITTAPVSVSNPTQKVNLSTLIGAPNNYWGDDDGDGQGASGITATGTLSVAITDAKGKAVRRSDVLSGCNSPYKVVLTSTAGSLITKYGIPNVTSFTGDSATYYITPKIDVPYVCYAAPNLKYGESSESAYWGPTNQWDPETGFKVQDKNTPSSNFPTTGSNNLYFNLRIAGALGSDITYDKNPTTSGLDLIITANGNTAKVALTGPGSGATLSQASTAVPTTFTFYSDATKTKVIYSFTISKWYIAKPSGAGGYTNAQAYCNNLGYRVPKRADYTNNPSIFLSSCQGNGSDGGACSGGNYKRTIGGGLFAEWGWTTSDYYASSEWENSYYWTLDKWSGVNYYVVGSTNGVVYYYPPTLTYLRAGCVTP